MQLFEVFGVAALDPIPKAIRVGDLLHGSRIDGRDPLTGEYPASIKAQLANAYAMLRSVVESGGATVANIAQVSFFLKNFDDRPLINEPWVEMFSDADDRPTYKFMPAPLLGDQLVQMEFFAVPGSSRRDIHIRGVAHTNPIPMAVQIGNYLFSSRLLGYDPDTEKAAETAEAQADFLIQHMQTILDAAGFSWRDVVQGRGFVVEPGLMSLLTSRWARCFPEGGETPPLHSIRYGAGSLQVMLEFIANKTD